MRLVADWRRCHRWFSMHAMGWSAGLLLTWNTLPPKLQSAVAEPLMTAIVVVILVLGMFGRVVEQGPAPPPSTYGDSP